jgi:serine/threonine protein kinase
MLADRYRLDERVGEGGMATVYRAWDNVLNRAVAVKVLHPHALSEAERNTFLHEARALARVRHPNVVAIYDAGLAGEQPYLVMELLQGPTLRAGLAYGPLALDESLRIARRLAEALAVAHDQQVLHLDVKPENVIFDEHDEPRLSDFGISRLLDEDHQPNAEGILGTAGYLAPEYLSDQPVDGRADVYGLGVVLYEMLTGHCPFCGDTPTQQVAQQLVVDPAPPETVNTAVPPRLGQLVMRALARNPAERFASARELAQALRDYQRETHQPTAALHRAEAHPPAAPSPADPTLIPAPALSEPAAPSSARAATSRAPARSHPTPRRRATIHEYDSPSTGCSPTALWFLSVFALCGIITLALAVGILPRVTALAPNPAGMPAQATRTSAPTLPASATPAAEPTTVALPTSVLAIATITNVSAAPTIAPTTSAPTTLPPTETTIPPTPVLPTVTATSAAPTPTFTLPSATAFVPTATTILPTATRIPPTATLFVPTTTSVPTTATSIPPTATIPPFAATNIIRLEDTQWFGSYRRSGTTIYGGRTATWIYGATTAYNSMEATFILLEQPIGLVQLQIEGMDSEGTARTMISIEVNGLPIYLGPNPLPDDDLPLATGTWATATWDFDGTLLHPGQNTIRISNLEPGAFSLPPFFMLDYADVILPVSHPQE